MESFQKIKPYAVIGSVQTRKMKSTNHDAVKLVYKGHSGEPEQVLFIYRFKRYAQLINGENEAALYRVICFIEVPFKASLTIHTEL